MASYVMETYAWRWDERILINYNTLWHVQVLTSRRLIFILLMRPGVTLQLCVIRKDPSDCWSSYLRYIWWPFITIFQSSYWHGISFLSTVPEIITGDMESAMAVDLNPWVEYEFRVVATNPIGTGDPSTPSRMIRTNEAGKNLGALEFYSVWL